MEKDSPTKKASYNVLYRPSEEPYERMNQASRPNQLKQVFLLLGLVGLVVLIPVLLVSILNPETIFETRREAAEELIYYGLISEIPAEEIEDLPVLSEYYLTDTEGQILDTDTTSAIKYVLFPTGAENTWESYVNGYPEKISPDQLTQIGTSSYWMVGSLSGTLISESTVENRTPSVSILEYPESQPIVGEEYKLYVKFEDPDSELSDYIKNATIELEYFEDASTPNWSMTFDDEVLGEKFPYTAVAKGVPTAESAGKKLKLSVTVTDILNATSPRAERIFSVTKVNHAPVIESFTCSPTAITFETGCPTTAPTDQNVTCTVNASDEDEDELQYNFTAISEFSPVSTSGNEITFQVSPGDPAGTYSLKVNVTEVGCTENCKEAEEEVSFTLSEEEVQCPEKQAPTAIFTANPSKGDVPLTVTINPSKSSDPDGTIKVYKWSFGDGQQQEYNQGTAFNHIYDREGIYTLSLEVTDDDDLKDTYSSIIYVGENNEPEVTLLKPNGGIFSGSKTNPENKIIWQASDTEFDSPLHYEIDLLSTNKDGTCDTTSLSSANTYNLTYGNLAYDSASETYYPLSFEWNTDNSISGNVPDGYYCVKITVSDNTYGHSVLDYSDQVIEIQNAEHPPVFKTESIPEGVKETAYSTQILAYDEDGDDLQFNMVYSPDWININTEGRLYGTPNESGPFNIVVAVTDGNSERSKSYTLNVKATEGQVLPAVTLAASAEVFIGSNGKINWSLTNDQDVATLELEYSTNGKDWTSIVSGLSKDTNEYVWDVTELDPGKYYIRLVYYDQEGNKLGASDIRELEVARPETVKESSPNVFNLKPEDGGATSDLTPVISANFSPSRGAQVDTETISVYLDNDPLMEATGFDGFEGGFAYIPQEELSVGVHYIKAGFRDSEGKVVDKRWSFTITSDKVTTVEEGKKDYTKYFIAIGAIFGIAALTVVGYFLVQKINEDLGKKRAFTPKLSALEIKDEEEAKLNKVYKGVRASLEQGVAKKKEPLVPTKPSSGDTLPPLPQKNTKPMTQDDKLPKDWAMKENKKAGDSDVKPIDALK